jgi:hypothetical protein
MKPPVFWTVKDLAVEMDIHPRNVKRWVKRIGIQPDLPGHGPHRWREATARRIIHAFTEFYRRDGTTPQIRKAKISGKFTDTAQLDLSLN